jgi:hypothetical protein
MRASVVFGLVIAWTSLGCGTAPPAVPENDAGTTSPDAWTPPPDDAGHDGGQDAYVPPGGYTTTLATGPYHVASGVEQTFCITLDLGNDTAMMLRGVHTHISDGSHHLVVSRADGSVADPTPTPCPPLAHGVGQAIFIAESHESGLVYPAGAGLPMAPHQIIGLELHMIDLGSGPLDIAGMVDFDLVPVDPSVREVHILFTGDLSLDLPPHMDTTVSDLFPMTPGTEVLAMTTHTHQLGIDATLDVTTGAGDPGTRVHESTSWSDPPLTLFDPPLVIGSAQQIRLTCTFRNTTSSTVGFGTGFNDEMCFFWAYYLDPA